jgi:LPS O-antigen subunit length determinant protein (WzzB/FepE family)
MTMPDRRPNPDERPIPLILWAILGLLVVALFVLLAGVVGGQG